MWPFDDELDAQREQDPKAFVEKLRVLTRRAKEGDLEAGALAERMASKVIPQDLSYLPLSSRTAFYNNFIAPKVLKYKPELKYQAEDIWTSAGASLPQYMGTTPWERGYRAFSEQALAPFAWGGLKKKIEEAYPVSALEAIGALPKEATTGKQRTWSEAIAGFAGGVVPSLGLMTAATRIGTSLAAKLLPSLAPKALGIGGSIARETLKAIPGMFASGTIYGGMTGKSIPEALKEGVEWAGFSILGGIATKALTYLPLGRALLEKLGVVYVPESAESPILKQVALLRSPLKPEVTPAGVTKWVRKTSEEAASDLKLAESWLGRLSPKTRRTVERMLRKPELSPRLIQDIQRLRALSKSNPDAYANELNALLPEQADALANLVKTYDDTLNQILRADKKADQLIASLKPSDSLVVLRLGQTPQKVLEDIGASLVTSEKFIEGTLSSPLRTPEGTVLLFRTTKGLTPTQLEERLAAAGVKDYEGVIVRGGKQIPTLNEALSLRAGTTPEGWKAPEAGTHTTLFERIVSPKTTVKTPKAPEPYFDTLSRVGEAVGKIQAGEPGAVVSDVLPNQVEVASRLVAGAWHSKYGAPPKITIVEGSIPNTKSIIIGKPRAEAKEPLFEAKEVPSTPPSRAEEEAYEPLPPPGFAKFGDDAFVLKSPTSLSKADMLTEAATKGKELSRGGYYPEIQRTPTGEARPVLRRQVLVVGTADSEEEAKALLAAEKAYPLWQNRIQPVGDQFVAMRVNPKFSNEKYIEYVARKSTEVTEPGTFSPFTGEARILEGGRKPKEEVRGRFPLSRPEENIAPLEKPWNAGLLKRPMPQILREEALKAKSSEEFAANARARLAIQAAEPDALYHYTTPFYVRGILEKGILPGADISASSRTLVSMTRAGSLEVPEYLSGRSVRVVIDKSALSTTKTEPYLYPKLREVESGLGKEAEERVERVPLEAIRRIDVQPDPRWPSEVKEIEEIKKLAREKGIPVMDLSKKGMKEYWTWVQKSKVLDRVFRAKGPGHERFASVMDTWEWLTPEGKTFIQYVLKDVDDKALKATEYLREGEDFFVNLFNPSETFGTAATVNVPTRISPYTLPEESILHEIGHVFHHTLKAGDYALVNRVYKEMVDKYGPAKLAEVMWQASLTSRPLPFRVLARLEGGSASQIRKSFQQHQVADASEFFANSFTSYVLTKKSFAPELEGVLNRAWHWLRQRVQSLIRSNLYEDAPWMNKLKPLFDDILSGGSLTTDFSGREPELKMRELVAQSTKFRLPPVFRKAASDEPATLALAEKALSKQPPPPEPPKDELPPVDPMKIGFLGYEQLVRRPKYMFEALERRTGIPVYSALYRPIDAGRRKMLKAELPYLRRLNSIFSGLSLAQREKVTAYRENPFVAADPVVRRAANALKKWFDDLYKEFEIKAPYLENYMSHIGRYGLEAAIMKYPELKADHKFFADMIRKGILKRTETDALVIASRYLREGMWNRHVAPVWKQIVKEMRKKGGGLYQMPPVVKKAVTTWMERVRGIPTEHQLFAKLAFTRVLQKLGMKNAAEIAGKYDLVDTIASLWYSGTLGYRLSSLIRNLFQVPITSYSYLGTDGLAEGYARALTRQGREEAIRDGVLTESLVAAHTAVPPKIKKITDLGLSLYQKVDDFNRAVTYLGAKHKALNVFRKGGTIDQKMWRSGADLLREIDRQNVRELLTQGRFEDAARYIGNEIQEMTQFAYSAGSRPLRGPFAGRLTGMFATFPMQYSEWLASLFSAGTPKARLLKVARALAVHGAVLSAGSALGLNLTSWVGLGPAIYTGGPLLQVGLETPRLFSNLPVEREMARRRILRAGQVLVPGMSLIQDIIKAKQEGTPEGAIAALALGRSTLHPAQ